MYERGCDDCEACDKCELFSENKQKAMERYAKRLDWYTANLKRFYFAGKRVGKSMWNIIGSASNKVPIICQDEKDRERIKQQAKKYGFVIPEPITWKEVEEKKHIKPVSVKTDTYNHNS
jgi:hypothetical protein